MVAIITSRGYNSSIMLDFRNLYHWSNLIFFPLLAISWCLSIFLYYEKVTLYLSDTAICSDLYVDMIKAILHPGNLFGVITLILISVFVARYVRGLQLSYSKVRKYFREIVFLVVVAVIVLSASIISWYCNV